MSRCRRSTSRVTVSASGSKTFTTQPYLPYSNGQTVWATVLYNGEWIQGTVSSYSGTQP